MTGLLRHGGLAAALASGLVLGAGAHAAGPDTLTAGLAQRLQAVAAAPGNPAAYERLQAQQAIAAATAARSRDRDAAMQVATQRVQIAEIAARTQAVRQQIDVLARERSDLLVESSRQDAERARAESERLRVQAQMQAEESERLRAAADEQALARQDAELTLDSVAGDQAGRLRAARQREAELARQEAALMGAGPAAAPPRAPAAPPKAKPKAKAKPKPAKSS